MPFLALVHLYAHVYANVYMHVYRCVHTHGHTHAHTHAHVQVYAHVYRILLWMSICIHMLMPFFAHILKDTFVCTHV